MMLIPYNQQTSDLARSTPVYALVKQESNKFASRNIYGVAQATSLPVFLIIEKGFTIYNSHLMRSAIVLQPFSVKVWLVQEEFVATSGISDGYELGETNRLAVRNYLYSFVDELIWFQQHRDSLSDRLLENFAKLQLYLSLV